MSGDRKHLQSLAVIVTVEIIKCKDTRDHDSVEGTRASDSQRLA